MIEPGTLLEIPVLRRMVGRLGDNDELVRVYGHILFLKIELPHDTVYEFWPDERYYWFLDAKGKKVYFHTNASTIEEFIKRYGLTIKEEKEQQ